MKKRLIFYWYINKKGWHWVYDLHVEYLSKYKDIFDSIKFIISKDDDTKQEDVDNTIAKLKEACPNMTYEFFKNDKKSRESKFFYDEIVKKFSQFGTNDAIFFAHNKGVQSVYVKKDVLKEWIKDMYANNLSDKEKITKMLEEKDVCCIGTHLLKGVVPPQMLRVAKHKWHYSGTFFWLVPRRIDNYIRSNNVEIVENNGRWYAEGFLATVLPCDDKYVKGV